MSIEIRVPTLGESVTEATIGQWYKKAGEAVAMDEPLVELETDKVTIEVPSPSAGVLSDIAANDGDTVGVGALLGAIDENGAGASASAAAPAPAAPAPEAPAAAAQPPAEAAAGADSAGGRPPSPSAAKLIAENGMDADAISGSGKQGQVLKEDVLNALAGDGAPQPSAAPAASGSPAAAKPVASADQGVREERVRMTKLRQTIARRLKEAQNTAAMLTTFNDVDMGAIMELRSEYKALFEKKHGTKLGFMGFFVKAAVQALRELPAINAEIDGTDLVYKNYYNVGVAVGTDKGLVVPVVRDADALSIADIEKTIAGFGKKARDGKLGIAEMQGGTFTITNGGVYGSLMSTPILNAPQSGILGMHRIEQRPVMYRGEIAARPMMYLALSYDHRIVDGKEAVTFLVRIKESIEDPRRLVMDL